MSRQQMAHFHPAFLHTVLLNVTENHPAVNMCGNPHLSSVQMVPVGPKRLPQPINHRESNVEPTTEPMTTKAPPLNLQWSNWSVGSAEPIKSGQQWLPQQQFCVEDKGHSINVKNVSGDRMNCRGAR